MINKKINSQLLLIFLIETPLLVLSLPRGKTPIAINAFFWITGCLLLFHFRNRSQKRISFDISYPLLSLSANLLIAFLFYIRWNKSGVTKIIAETLKLPQKKFCLTAGLILSILSVWGMDYLIRVIFFDPQTRINRKTKTFIFIFLISFITITLNSECSPLYPFNTWGDPNCMMTVGKGILKGFVPYRDLYEQKGPLMLFLHTLGAAVSFNNFTGVWVLEILFCCLFLLIAHKTLGLFFEDDTSILLPVFSAAVYSRWAFEAGDTAEEFCLPLIAYSIFIACKSLQQNVLPSKKEFFIIGITSGCVFWTKYSMVGFYAGWFLFFLLIALKNKKIIQLLHGTGLIILGVTCITLPVFIYFAFHKALPYLFKVYFYNLIFVYAKSNTTILQNLSGGFEYLRLGNQLSVMCCALGTLWFLYRRLWKQALFIVITFLTAFFFIFFSNKRFIYYGMIFSAFTVFGFFWFAGAVSCIGSLKHTITKHHQILSSAIMIGSMLFLCFTSRNIHFLENEKENLMQYRIRDMIRSTGIDNPALLEYQTASTGVNTVMGTIPNVRYFCDFTIPLDEIDQEQTNCFEEGCADFVIIETREIYDFQEFEKYIHLGGYEGNIHDTKRPYYYHLYMNKEAR